MSQTLEPTTTALEFGSAGIRLTPEEFDAIEQYDENYRYELIRGVLVVNPIPSMGEAEPNDHLGHLLRLYRKNQPQGACIDATAQERFVHLPDSRRRADRLIWAGLGRKPDPAVDPPTIAVEFVSSSRRDRQRDYVEKKAEYLAAGVQEYWIIDRFARSMTVYRQGQERPIVVNEQGVYKSDLLPGFELPLAEILAESDPWQPPSA